MLQDCVNHEIKLEIILEILFGCARSERSEIRDKPFVKFASRVKYESQGEAGIAMGQYKDVVGTKSHMISLASVRSQSFGKRLICTWPYIFGTIQVGAADPSRPISIPEQAPSALAVWCTRIQGNLAAHIKLDPHAGLEQWIVHFNAE